MRLGLIMTRELAVPAAAFDRPRQRRSGVGRRGTVHVRQTNRRSVAASGSARQQTTRQQRGVMRKSIFACLPALVMPSSPRTRATPTSRQPSRIDTTLGRRLSVEPTHLRRLLVFMISGLRMQSTRPYASMSGGNFYLGMSRSLLK